MLALTDLGLCLSTMPGVLWSLLMVIGLYPHVSQLFLICSFIFLEPAVLSAMPLDRLIPLCPPRSCTTMPTGMRAAKIGLMHPQRSRLHPGPPSPG